MTIQAQTLTKAELNSAIVRNPLIVSSDITVMEAIALMSGGRAICESTKTEDADNVHTEARASCVLVCDGEKIIGIMTERDVVKLSAQQCSLNDLAICDVMASPVFTLKSSEYTDLFFAVNLLQQHHIRHMPILDDQNQVIGIITHESLRQLARPVDLLRLRLVSEVMTADVACAEIDSSLLTIARMMAERRISSVLIVEARVGINGEPLQIPLGIITERDLVQCQSLSLNFETVQAQMLMSSPVFAVSSGDTLMVVQQIMEQRSIRRLVVAGSQGELLGIVTQTSLLQALNPIELYTLAKILEEKVSKLEAEKIKFLEDYANELELKVEQRTAVLKTKADREELVTTIANRIRKSLHLDETLDTITSEIRQFLKTDRVVIYKFNPDMSGTVVTESSLPGWTATKGIQIIDTCFQDTGGKKYRTGHKKAIADIYEAGLTDCHLKLLERFEVKANLVAPIIVKEELWGLLIAHQCDKPRQWQTSELDFLEQLTIHIVIAIQQATTYQQAQTELTERKRVELELKQSEQLYVTLARVAPVGIFRTDPDGNCLYVNERWCQISGLTPTEASGYGWVNAIHPEDRSLVNDEWNASVQDNRHFNLEYRFQNPSGQVVWVYGQSEAELSPNGEVISYVGTITDISDRKQAEAERLQAEQIRQELELLEDIFDVILAGYWDWDIPNNQEYLSLGFKQMFGYEDHEMPNSPESWQRIIFAEDLPKVLDCFDRHIKSRGVIPFYNEVRYHHKNGSTVWVICSGKVTKWDKDGKPLRMIGCHVDITEQKQSEQLLKKSDAHLKTAQRIGKLGSWEFDLQSGQVDWSDEVFRIFGRNPELGAPSFDELQQLLHPDDRNYHQEMVQMAIATNQPYSVECRFHRPDGTLGHMEARGEPICDVNGSLVQLVGTVLDISDRKQSELKLMQTSSQLEASNSELEAFAYSVSHDLRSPLRAINGFSQALVEDYGDKIDADGRDYIDRICKNVNRMGLLIDDLLRLSRVSRSEIQYRAVNLSDIVNQQMQELQSQDPDRSVEVVIADGVIVQADTALMGVVLSNLLQNAWKFTSHHATARIEFGIINQDRQLTYFVKDDGAGFNMKYANKLFCVFQRLHNTQEFSGTGIGLATVQRAIKRHGGNVWAESAIEQGATFYFTIPTNNSGGAISN